MSRWREAGRTPLPWRTGDPKRSTFDEDLALFEHQVLAGLSSEPRSFTAVAPEEAPFERAA